MKLNASMKSQMLPHLLVVSEWVALVLILIFNVDFSILVTGAFGDGGLKAITVFHVWMLIFSIVWFSIFLKIRKQGAVEKSITGLSLMILVFSIVTIYFHFVNDFVLLMKSIEVAVWTLHNGIFSMSLYKILVVFLLPLLKR